MSELIEFISLQGKLLDFMGKYGLVGLMYTNEEQIANPTTQFAKRLTNSEFVCIIVYKEVQKWTLLHRKTSHNESVLTTELFYDGTKQACSRRKEPPPQRLIIHRRTLRTISEPNRLLTMVGGFALTVVNTNALSAVLSMIMTITTVAVAEQEWFGIKPNKSG